MLANQEILELVCFLFLSVQLNKQTSERIDESCSEQVAKYLKYLNFFDLLEAYFDVSLYHSEGLLTVLGKLGPGQLGPGQLGPGAQLSRAEFATF